MNYPPSAEHYEPIDYAAIPVGVKWKPSVGNQREARRTYFSTPGNFYKLIRQLDTGDVAYFKLKDFGAEKSPAEKEADRRRIDAEPERPKQVRYGVGKHCWLIVNARWFCCEVTARTQNPNTITLRPTTGWDAERKTPWPHEGDLTFSSVSTLFKHLRPLKARLS